MSDAYQMTEDQWQRCIESLELIEQFSKKSMSNRQEDINIHIGITIVIKDLSDKLYDTLEEFRRLAEKGGRKQKIKEMEQELKELKVEALTEEEETEPVKEYEKAGKIIYLESSN